MVWLKDAFSRERMDYLLLCFDTFHCSGQLSRELLELKDWPIGKDKMITSLFLMFTLPEIEDQPIIKNCMYIYCNKGVLINEKS